MMLEIYDNLDDKRLLVWVFKCSDNDGIMVVFADDRRTDINDMFDNKACKLAKYFDLDNYDEAIQYTYNVIKRQFNKYFKEVYDIKFNMHKSLVDLQKIALDYKELDYNNYYDLATFEDKGQLYFCDLIILDGKLGLRYSKYHDSYYDGFDNLSFEEWNPDLSNNYTLMLGMQEKLNNFIEKELENKFAVGVDI